MLTTSRPGDDVQRRQGRRRRRRDDIRGNEATTHGTEGEKHRASQRSSEIRMCSPPHLPVGYLINAHPGAGRHRQPRSPPAGLHAATTPVFSVFTHWHGPEGPPPGPSGTPGA